MSNKSEVTQMINNTEAELNATLQAAGTGRGILNDVVGLVVPMQKDQLAILRKIAEGLPD